MIWKPGLNGAYRADCNKSCMLLGLTTLYIHKDGTIVDFCHACAVDSTVFAGSRERVWDEASCLTKDSGLGILGIIRLRTW